MSDFEDYNAATHYMPSKNASGMEKHEAGYNSATKSVLFLFTVLMIGCFVKQVLKKYHLPYTVVLFILSTLFGYFTYGSKEVASYEDMTRMPAHILMQMFLPILIFESAYTMDSHFFLRSMSQCLLLAIPGLVVCAALTAGYSKTVLSVYKWDWTTCFLFGCILSATDPVAVVALLKEAGISPALTTLIEGESLLNDGAAIVIFEVLFESLKGAAEHELNATAFILAFTRVGLGAPFFGYLMGLITSWIILQIDNDAVVEFTVTFGSAFLSYFAAEELKLSGVLTVVTLGIVVNRNKSSFSPESEEVVRSFWEMMGYFANTLIFSIVGIIISRKAILFMVFTDALFALATYVAVTVFRFAMVLLFSPLLNRMGYGLPWKNAVVLIWGGLRGAVGLALALMLSEEHTMKCDVSNKILVQLSMIIVLTLVVNGVTMKYLLQILGLNEIPQSRQVAMAHAVVHLRNVVSKSINIRKRDNFLSDANWLWIESHTHINDPYNATDEFDIDCQYTPYKTSQCPKCHEDHSVIPSTDELAEMTEETRLHVLKASKVCYWKYFERGLVTGDTVNILNSVANEAIDRPGKYIDVKTLKRYMTVSLLIQTLTTYLTSILDRLGAESFQVIDNDLTILYNEATGFRQWCLKLITSPFWQPAICLIILSNAVVILLEANRIDIVQIWGTYWVLYQMFAVIYLLLYISEAIIKITGIGWKSYIHSGYNIFALLLIIFGPVTIILDIYFRVVNKLDSEIIVLLRLVWLIRLIELYKMFWRLLLRLVEWLKNKTSSRLYRAYDLGRGYQMAQNEVMEKINYVVDYKPCAVVPLRESEHGVLEIMKEMASLQKKHRGIVLARKSHIAAIDVLNDVNVALHELLESGLLEVVEYERLKFIVFNLKLKIQRSPKFLSASKSAEEILRKTGWLVDKRLFETVYKKYVVKDYKAQQSIHEAGQMGNGISIVTSGVIKITGTASIEKTDSLPNTDSFQYFSNTGNFFEYVSTGYCLGLISSTQDAEFVTTAVCETDVHVLHISTNTLNTADTCMSEKPSLSYVIWRNISLKIALPILLEHSNFESNMEEKINLKLESCVIPDLETAVDFTINELVEDIVLIQGKVRDTVAGKLYIGPCYIPNTVQHMVFFDQPDYRPRVVMLLIAEESYSLPEELDWSGQDSSSSRAKLCLLHTVQHRRSTILEFERKQVEESTQLNIITESQNELMENLAEHSKKKKHIQKKVIGKLEEHTESNEQLTESMEQLTTSHGKRKKELRGHRKSSRKGSASSRKGSTSSRKGSKSSRKGSKRT